MIAASRAGPIRALDLFPGTAEVVAAADAVQCSGNETVRGCTPYPERIMYIKRLDHTHRGCTYSTCSNTVLRYLVVANEGARWRGDEMGFTKYRV